MKLIVAKFGGTSVGTIDRIKSVAARMKKEVNNGYNVIVVVSAMAGETNRLIKLVENLTNNHRTNEYDTVISSGEQVTSGLVAIALNELGIKSKSYQGWQIPFETDNNFIWILVQKGECQNDMDCPDNRACIGNQCLDPCVIDDPCGTNAQCETTSHRPVCRCPNGWAGDPHTECYQCRFF